MPDACISINKVLAKEGSAVIENDDGRGPSKYGVTLKTAQGFGLRWTADDIRHLSPDSARLFYLQYFYAPSNVALLHNQELSDKVFDLAVNLWIPTAVRLLQRAVGVKIDGVLGMKTADAANAMNPEDALSWLRAMAETHYREIAAKYPQEADKLPGWLNRLAMA